jgi:hypothetical protein
VKEDLFVETGFNTEAVFESFKYYELDDKVTESDR